MLGAAKQRASAHGANKRVRIVARCGGDNAAPAASTLRWRRRTGSDNGHGVAVMDIISTRRQHRRRRDST
jgi:hypothetical protein